MSILLKRFLTGIKYLFLLLLACILIRTVLGEPCSVPSGSMEPTLLCGDRLWINKLAYGGRLPERWADIPLVNVFTWIRPLREADERNRWGYRRLPGYTQPRKGDIAVFNSPYDPQLLLVKRITQVIEKGDTLPINRRTLPQYRSLILRDGGSVSEARSGIFVNGKRSSVYVPTQNFYYMRGDNALNSQDSRSFGFIPETALVGKFDFVLFSLDPDKPFWQSIRWERTFGRLK